VIEQEPVEQRLVAVLQGREPDVLLQVIRLPAEVLNFQRNLLLDRARCLRRPLRRYVRDVH
jgi:hypothetical protein